jgi:hypothetical protein
MTLQLFPSKCPYIWGKFYLIFYQCGKVPQFCLLWTCERYQLLAELSCKSSIEDFPLLDKLFLFLCNFNYFIKKYQITEGTEFYFSVVEFYGHSGRLISERVCNIGRRANKCQQITYRPFLWGCRQMFWYIYWLINPCSWACKWIRPRAYSGIVISFPYIPSHAVIDVAAT